MSTKLYSDGYDIDIWYHSSLIVRKGIMQDYGWWFVMINHDVSWVIMINLHILSRKITIHARSPKIMKLDHQRSWKMFHLTRWFLVINHDSQIPFERGFVLIEISHTVQITTFMGYEALIQLSFLVQLWSTLIKLWGRSHPMYNV